MLCQCTKLSCDDHIQHGKQQTTMLQYKKDIQSQMHNPQGSPPLQTVLPHLSHEFYYDTMIKNPSGNQKRKRKGGKVSKYLHICLMCSHIKLLSILE